MYFNCRAPVLYLTYLLSDRGRSIVRMSTGGRAPHMQMFGARMQMCRGGGNSQLEESIAQLLVDAGECLLVAYVCWWTSIHMQMSVMLLESIYS